MAKEYKFDSDGKLSPDNKNLVKDKDGNLGCWFTSERKDKYFVRLGETPQEAWKRYFANLLNLSTNELKKKQTIDNSQSDGHIQLPKNEYAQLCSAIRTRYTNKIPKQGTIKVDGMFYIFTYSKKDELILCLDKITIVGNETYIKRMEKIYE